MFLRKEKSRWRHYLVRLVSLALAAHVILGTFSRDYFQASLRISPFPSAYEAYFLMASTVVLPLLVLFEMFRSDGSVNEWRALLIDLGSTVLWFGVLWSLAFYALTHYAFF
jgi:hypothetical protein